MSLGDLQAKILGVLQRLGRASAREVLEELRKEEDIAYTTVSTVLDRLYRKGLVRRAWEPSRRGVRYVYYMTVGGSALRAMIDGAIDRLVKAFGPDVIPMIYDRLEVLSEAELEELKRKVSRRRVG